MKAFYDVVSSITYHPNDLRDKASRLAHGLEGKTTPYFVLRPIWHDLAHLKLLTRREEQTESCLSTLPDNIFNRCFKRRMMDA
jgi:hypothetical protein